MRDDRDHTPDTPPPPAPTRDDGLDCHAAIARLWDYLDGELGEADARAVDAHLAECERCPPHFTFERAFLAAVGRARTIQGGGARLRDRVLAVLVTEGFSPP